MQPWWAEETSFKNIKNPPEKADHCFKWLNENCSCSFISASVQNSSQPAESSNGECSAVPTHLRVHVWSGIMGSEQGVPQTFIQAVEIRYRTASFSLVLFLSSHFPDSKHDSFSLMFECDVWMQCIYRLLILWERSVLHSLFFQFSVS